MSERKLKILHMVEFYDPSLGGAQEVVKRISELLVKAGHEVTVATTFLPERKHRTIEGVKIEEFRVSGNTVNGMTGEIQRYQEFLRESKFDIVMNYAAQQWTFDAAIPVLDQMSGKKVFVPCGFSGLYWAEYKNYFAEMPNVLRKYDHLVFLSENYRDINFAKEHALTKLSVIPNGCAKTEFEPTLTDVAENELRVRLGIPKNDRIVLHVGSHTGVKGHRETIQIFNQANLGDATLVIVGNSYSRKCTQRCRLSSRLSRLMRGIGLRKNKILSVALPRRDTVSLYKMADAFLFPSNIECSPIVLFESMAARTPFLSTDVGNAKEIVGWSSAGKVLPTEITQDGFSYAQIAKSAEMLVQLLSNQSEVENLGENGRSAWLKSFTWEKISEAYLELYLSLQGSPHA